MMYEHTLIDKYVILILESRRLKEIFAYAKRIKEINKRLREGKRLKRLLLKYTKGDIILKQINNSVLIEVYDKNKLIGIVTGTDILSLIRKRKNG